MNPANPSSSQELTCDLLVVGSGLYVWHRERVRAKAP